MAPGGFNLLAADDLIARPIAAFDQNIGKQASDYFARRRLIENQNGIYAFEGRKDLRAFQLRQHRPPRSFDLPYTGIAVNANDERVAKRACLLENAKVPWMEQIEAAVREDNAAPVAFLTPEPQNHFVQRQNPGMQRNSMKARATTELHHDQKLVYHAGVAQRFGARHPQ